LSKHRTVAVSRRRVLVIANSSAGRVRDSLDEALKVLKEQGCDYTIETPENADILIETVSNGRQNYDAVVIAGGDGTLNAALPALMGEGAPIGILPFGTANDLARTLELPLEPTDAARVVASGRVRRIDVGCLNQRYFFNVAHVGVGARAKRSVTEESKRRWRGLSYPMALVQTLKTYRPFRVRIDVDGHSRRLWAVHVAVGSGCYFGGGVPVSAEAHIADGKLDVYCIRAVGPWRLLRAVGAIWRGGPGPDTLWRASGHTIELITRRPHHITADGEAFGKTPASFHVEAGVVPVIVPEQRTEGKAHVP